MTMLLALNRAYDRLAARGDVPPFGYSTEKIGFLIPLADDGSPHKPVDLRETNGKRQIPRALSVPQPVKRSSNIAPNFLWDNAAYVLGLSDRSVDHGIKTHSAFVDFHLDALKDTDDAGLIALLRFLQSWQPEQAAERGWSEDMIGSNIVFALERERRQNLYLHDRPAARDLWAGLSTASAGKDALCLVTGQRGPVARLHPAIKGVMGAQSSGASLVSFNLDAFTSYGHRQGDNAPISEAAAFAYASVLNKFLSRGSGHQIRVGDTATVFWADASDAELTDTAETTFPALFSSIDDAQETQKISHILEKIRAGETLASFAPNLAKGVRFYVLGLAPNAARLSVRFWFEGEFGHLVSNYQRFLHETAIDPPPLGPSPALWQYLLETAVRGKSENVPPNLAGDFMRSILTGTRYPATLLATLLARLRADKSINGRRTALLKALLIRNFNMKETPVSLDKDYIDTGYLLGRLFAVYERIQSAALGKDVNATIKDKYYGSASAQPRRVFAALDRGAAHHLSKIGKKSPGLRVNLDRDVMAITEMMGPADDPFPASLSSAQQALFSLGYYHQRNAYFPPNKSADKEERDQ